MGTNTYIKNNKHIILEIINNKKEKYKVLFDKEDYDIVCKYNWRILKNKQGNNYYVISNQNNILMHRLIMKFPKEKVIDHKNHNGLDNRKKNLKICSQYENMQNQSKRINNKSGYSNICFEKNRNKWVVYININKRKKKVRTNTFEEAIKIRNKLLNERSELYGL